MTTHCSALRFIDPTKERQYAQRRLDYYPMDTVERELNKKIAWEYMRSDDPDLQIRGLILLNRSYFDRSMEYAMLYGYWSSHPTSHEDFGRMIDYADNEMIPEAALAAYRRKFGAYRPGHIEPGNSVWQPK